MRCPTYLSLSRHSIYYLRWPLPRKLHPQGKQTWVRVSLKTRNPASALLLTRSLSYVATLVVAQGLAHGMQYDEIRNRLTAYFNEVVKLNVERISASGRLSEQEVAHLKQGAAYGSDSYQIGLENHPELQSFLKWSQIEVVEGTKNYDLVLTEYERAYSDHCERILDYDQSLSKYVFENMGLNEKSSASRKIASHTLSAVIEKYFTEQMGERHWGSKSEYDKKKHFKLLQEILGPNVDINTVLGDEARKVKTTLQRFPANRNKNPITRGRTISEIMALPNVRTLNTATINQYLQSYTSLFEWAKSNSFVDQNYFDGMAIKVKRKSTKEGRQSFNRDQYEVMLIEILENRLGLIKKPYQKWGPLIGMYTGARLNEIAQLTLADIRCEEGIYCFDFNEDAEDKRLKNASSARRVPIHSKLLAWGLVGYIEEMRRLGKKKLFPDFPRDKTGGYGRNLGRWVNDVFLVKLGIKTSQYSFHSFRHTISNELQRTDVQLPIVQSILGHAKEGVTLQSYSKLGYTLRQLSDALEKFFW